MGRLRSALVNGMRERKERQQREKEALTKTAKASPVTQGCNYNYRPFYKGPSFDETIDVKNKPSRQVAKTYRNFDTVPKFSYEYQQKRNKKVNETKAHLTVNPKKSGFSHYKQTDSNDPKSKKIFHDIMDKPDTKDKMYIAATFLQSLGQEPNRDAWSLNEPKSVDKPEQKLSSQEVIVRLMDDFFFEIAQQKELNSEDKYMDQRMHDRHKFAKHSILPYNVFDQFVKCDATKTMYPKFVRKETAKPYYSELKFERQRTS